MDCSLAVQLATMKIFYDPLEQFEILLVVENYGLNNLAIVLFFIFLVAFSLITSVTSPVLSNVYSYFTTLIYTLVKTITKENLHIKRHQYFLMLFYLFITIFLSNLIGLIPYSFTPTSSFIMTFFLALGHFIGINFIAATQTRWETVNFFLPSGIPTVGAPFLVLIEFISYVARVFSLSTRLFANMMSGHALLKILASFSWSFIKSLKPISVLAVIPWVTVTAITTLEFLVAFLQAYVFTILITIYTSDVLVAH